METTKTLTELQIDNLIHNLNLGVDNPRIEGDKVLAEWQGEYHAKIGHSTTVIKNRPTVSIHISEFAKDLLESKYTHGEWVDFEILDADWITQSENKF